MPQPSSEATRGFGDSTAAARDASLDVARGLGILLVLYGHSLEALFLREDGVFIDSAFAQWRAIYAFHMPLFFLISGRAHALSGRVEIPWVRAGSLVLLALANHVIAGVMQIALSFYRGVTPTLHSLKPLLKPFLTGTDFSLGIMWFLLSLAAAQLLFGLWQTRPRAGSRFLVAVICSLSFYAATFAGGRLPNCFQIKSWLPSFAFFVLGYVWPSHKRISVWAGALCLLAVVALAPLNHGCAFAPGAMCGEAELHGRFAVWMFLGKLGFLPLFYATALLGCAGVMALSRHVSSRALGRLGKNSLHLFLVNSYVLAFGVHYLKRFSWSGIGWLGYLALFLGTVAFHLGLLLCTRGFFQRLEGLALAGARRLVALAREGLSAVLAGSRGRESA